MLYIDNNKIDYNLFQPMFKSGLPFIVDIVIKNNVFYPLCRIVMRAI